MAFEAGNLTLFGLDLRRGWDAFAQGWADALRWPAFAWLSPQEAIRVTMPDGSIQWREGLSARPARVGKVDAPQAVLLPDEIVLFRDLVLPDLLRRDLEQALTLEVDAHRPFPLEELIWGWRSALRDDGQLDVRLAMTSRRHVDSRLAALGWQTPPAVGELWADDAKPIALQGSGDDLRERRLKRRRARIIGLIAVCALLVFALAATPFLLQRQQVFEAQRMQGELQARTAPIVASREALVRNHRHVEAVQQHLRAQIDLPALLEQLTRLLPDNAYLSRLEVSGRTVRIAGLSPNAATLVELLGAQAEFADVRTPTAISRGAEGNESFTVEFTVRERGNPQ